MRGQLSIVVLNKGTEFKCLNMAGPNHPGGYIKYYPMEMMPDGFSYLLYKRTP